MTYLIKNIPFLQECSNSCGFRSHSCGFRSIPVDSGAIPADSGPFLRIPVIPAGMCGAVRSTGKRVKIGNKQSPTLVKNQMWASLNYIELLLKVSLNTTK